jgi:hypothetical protein
MTEKAHIVTNVSFAVPIGPSWTVDLTIGPGPTFARALVDLRISRHFA